MSNEIKLKVIAQFPPVATANGIYLNKNKGTFSFALDYSQFPIQSSPGNARLVVYDASSGQYIQTTSPLLGSAIVTTPSPLVVSDAAPVGSVVGTLSVTGGSGSYTFSLTSNPGGKYQIVGNQLEVAAPLTAGTDTITIHAQNAAGDYADLTTTITVTHFVAGYVPTYHIYGF